MKCRKQDLKVKWEENLIRSRGIPLMGGSCVDRVHSLCMLEAKLSDFSSETKSSPPALGLPAPLPVDPEAPPAVTAPTGSLRPAVAADSL